MRDRPQSSEPQQVKTMRLPGDTEYDPRFDIGDEIRKTPGVVWVVEDVMVSAGDHEVYYYLVSDDGPEQTTFFAQKVDNDWQYAVEE